MLDGDEYYAGHHVGHHAHQQHSTRASKGPDERDQDPGDRIDCPEEEPGDP